MLTYNEKDIIDKLKNRDVYETELNKRELMTIQSLIQKGKVQATYGSWSRDKMYALVHEHCKCCKQKLPYS